MRFVDTHCHIQSAGLQTGERSTRELWAKAPELTADAMITAAHEQAVTKMICVGCDIVDSALAVRCAAEQPSCWASVAVHPHEAAVAIKNDELDALHNLAQHPRVVAIGECGLDYFYEHSPRESQITALRYQLDLAVEFGLPVIFHVREAFTDFWPIFESYDGAIRGVLHSFTDSQANMERAVQHGLYIGVNGIATFTKDETQRAMYKAIPDDKLVLETDAPFLTPKPFRGKINQPQQITTIAAFLAEQRGVTVEQLAMQTTANAEHLFDI